MKTASAALIALLENTNATKLVQCDLYTFTLVDGTVARYTGGDVRIPSLGGHAFELGPKFKRGPTRTSTGVQVDNLDLTIMPAPTDEIDGWAWLAGATNGLFDGARVLVERFISDAWTNLAPGTIYQFNGRVSKLDTDRGKIAMTVESDVALLNTRLPRNVYQTTCLHALYDAGCNKDGTVNRAMFTTAGAAAAGSTTVAVKTGLTQADDYFNLGVIVFTSGQNQGLQRTIKAYANANGLVTVVNPFPYAPAASDTFTIYPGCNKLYTGDCLSKFNNQVNFKGTPFIPVAETAY